MYSIRAREPMTYEVSILRRCPGYIEFYSLKIMFTIDSARHEFGIGCTEGFKILSNFT